ncbi:MAG: carbon starvation protein A [Planctomycetota bacterium]
MNAALLAAGALAAFVVAHRTYARWLERKVFALDDAQPTPAHTAPDGVDCVPCGKHVLFGHHFCSVAGAAPIVGPAIAVIWGWLPALLWVVLGTIFIGAVHDFGALALSAQRGGRTIGDLAGTILSPRARVGFLGIIVLLTWIVLAVFAYLIAVLFTNVPASVWPINLEIVVALVLGWWVYGRGGRLLVPSLLALAVLYALVVVFARHPEAGVLPPALELAGSPIATWVVFLLAYAWVASVLPVRVLLQPRDYINSHQLFLGLGGLLLGLALSPGLEVTAPAINHDVPPGTPGLLPMLFITIACGAISGFHGLVASGTTAKQLDRMRDARTIGYGGMLGEGVLAMLAVLATTAGLGSAAEWRAQYGDWQQVGNTGITHFVAGASRFLEPLLAGDTQLAQTVIAVIVISFAATTLDTAARIQRFCLTELGDAFGVTSLRNRYVATTVAVVPAALLALLTDGGKGIGSGGFILWPVFGTTNQLIGALTLLVLYVVLRRAGRPRIVILVPLLFLLAMTTWAGIQGLVAETERGNAVVVTFGALFLALEALVLFEGLRALRRDPAV